MAKFSGYRPLSAAVGRLAPMTGIDRLRLPALLLLVAGVLASPSAAGAETFFLGGQLTIVERPAIPTGRLVIYIHGAGGGANDLDSSMAGVTEELLRRGFTVAASEAHGASTWGNPVSVADYVRLGHFLTYRHLYLIAASMGGLAGVQLIDRLHPVAWAGISPVCNLGSLAPLLRPNIEVAWPEGVPSYLAPVKARNVAGLQVILWASPEDTWVPKAANADLCRRWMSKGGAHVVEVSTEGPHSDPSNIQPMRLAGFFSRHG